MPEPDITRPKNKGAGYVIFLSWVIWAGALVAALAAPVAGHAGWKASQVQSEPARTAPSAQPAASQDSQSGAASAPPATSNPQSSPPPASPPQTSPSQTSPPH